MAFRALGWGGRFLVVGFASGGAAPKTAIPQLPLNLALLNERRVARHVASPACRRACRPQRTAYPTAPRLLERAPLHRTLHGWPGTAPRHALAARWPVHGAAVQGLPCWGCRAGGAAVRGAAVWGGRRVGLPRLPRRRCPVRSHQVLGVFWGAWKAREPEANRANIEAMLGLIARGELRPPRARVYRLHEWRTAFDDLMQHRAVGKVCIDLGAAEARL